MIQIAESKIVNPKINSNRELIFSVRIKREDYNNDLWDSICLASDNGTPLAIVMQEFQWEEAPDNNLSSKRSRLAYIMQKYSEKQGTDAKETINKLYNKYNITSRSQLTEKQLDEEIKIFTLGLEWD